jgi:hypothetical protein
MSSAAATSKPPLLVLIDSGNGTAQRMARALKANGIERFAILGGGEEILAHKGRPGLSRTTGAISPPPGFAPSRSITNR